MNEIRRVTVRSVGDDGLALVTDTLGREYEVRSDLRPKGSAPAAPGESWLMQRVPNGPWVLWVQYAAKAPAVTGIRSGSDALTLSLLDALVEIGLVRDETSP